MPHPRPYGMLGHLLLTTNLYLLCAYLTAQIKFLPLHRYPLRLPRNHCQERTSVRAAFVGWRADSTNKRWSMQATFEPLMNRYLARYWHKDLLLIHGLVTNCFRSRQNRSYSQHMIKVLFSQHCSNPQRLHDFEPNSRSPHCRRSISRQNHKKSTPGPPWRSSCLNV